MAQVERDECRGVERFQEELEEAVVARAKNEIDRGAFTEKRKLSGVVSAQRRNCSSDGRR
jgi:hypothetical protein